MLVQIVGVDKVFYSAFQSGKGSPCSVVTNTRVGIICIYAEYQFFFRALAGYLFIMQGDGHGWFIHQESYDTSSVAFGHEGQSGKFFLELILAVEVVFFGYEVCQQFFTQFVGQTYLQFSFLSGAWSEGKAEQGSTLGGQRGGGI